MDQFNKTPKIIEQGGGYSHYISHFLMGSRNSENVYHVDQLQKSIIALENISLQLKNDPEMKSKVDELHDKLSNIDIDAPVDKELLNEIQILFDKIKI